MARTFNDSLRGRPDRPRESAGPEVDPTDVDSARARVHVEEGRADSKHAKDLSQHLTVTTKAPSQVCVESKPRIDLK